MDRENLIKGLNDKIKSARALKKCFPKDAILGIYIKDIKNIINVIKSGGNALDVQNVCRWNYSAYFKIKKPIGMSLKEYSDINGNRIDIFLGVIPMSLQLSNDGINYTNVII